MGKTFCEVHRDSQGIKEQFMSEDEQTALKEMFELLAEYSGSVPGLGSLELSKKLVLFYSAKASIDKLPHHDIKTLWTQQLCDLMDMKTYRYGDLSRIKKMGQPFRDIVARSIAEVVDIGEYITEKEIHAIENAMLLLLNDYDFEMINEKCM